MIDLVQQSKRSLSNAITRLIVIISISITLIYSIMLLGYSWIVEDNIFNRLLNYEVSQIKAHYDDTGEIRPPSASFMTLHKDWREVPDEIVKQYQVKPTQVEFELRNGRTLHLQTIKLGAHQFVILADVDGFEVSKEFLPHVVIWLFIIASLLSLIVSLTGYAIARKLTKPLKQLADEVSDIAIEGPPPTLSTHYPNNELSVLAKAIELTFGALQKALNREANFTRDVSHEIRTPISIVKNIISNNNLTQTVTSHEYKQIERSTFELEKTTNTLLALARNESQQRESVGLTEMIENTLLQHFQLNHTERGRRLDLNVELEDGISLSANPNLVQILLNNVISNIVQYADQPQVQILLTQEMMVFSNFTSEPVLEEPEKQGNKSMNSSGIGQGLHLIERICKLNEWAIEASHQQNAFNLTVRFYPSTG